MVLLPSGLVTGPLAPRMVTGMPQLLFMSNRSPAWAISTGAGYFG